MLVLLIVIAAVVLLAVVLGVGGFGGYGGPVVHRRVIYRRRPPVQRVVTEHRVIEDPVDDPAYRP